MYCSSCCPICHTPRVPPLRSPGLRSLSVRLLLPLPCWRPRYLPASVSSNGPRAKAPAPWRRYPCRKWSLTSQNGVWPCHVVCLDPLLSCRIFSHPRDRGRLQCKFFYDDLHPGTKPLVGILRGDSRRVEANFGPYRTVKRPYICATVELGGKF